MKKLILSVSLIMAVSFTFAQKSNVSQAEKLATQDNPDFKTAREAIQKAMTDPTTMNDVKTYYIAGLIGEKENEDLYKKQAINQKIDTTAKGKAIMESIKYYLIADSLDNLPDEKGKIKPKFEKKIKDALKFYYNIQHNLFDYAAYLYEKKDFKGALNVFNTYLSIPNLPMMKDLNLPSNGYVKYYAAYAARSIPEHDTAIKYYTELKNDTVRTDDVYQLLTTEYWAIGDTVKYVETLKEGFNKFKDQPWYLQTLINYYIYTGKLDEASKYLDNAIEQTPDRAEYYAVKGDVEGRLDNVDVARAAYEKSLKLDPNSAKAYYGIGSLLYNKAYKMNEVAQSIKDNKIFNAEMDKVKGVYKESLPYLEKSYQLDPTNDECKRALRSLYYMFQMNDKYDELNK